MALDAPTIAELTALPLFGGAGRAEVAAFASQVHLGSAPAGDMIGREGEPGQRFWILLDGSVDITASTSSGRRLLARAGAGSILGELALLRDRPRTATLTTATPTRFVEGDRHALDALLTIIPVRARLRRLASERLAADLRPVHAELRDGTPVLLRPLLPTDRQALDTALRSLSSQSVRHRFFSASAPSNDLVTYLVDIDYVDHFAWTVLDASTHDGMAVARYVRTAPADRAEMAFTTVERFQGRGLATLLLGVLGVTALEAGVVDLTALVMEDNSAMRAVFRRAGGRTNYAEPGVVSVDIAPARAADLLDPDLRLAIARSVHDVVTAASLALT